MDLTGKKVEWVDEGRLYVGVCLAPCPRIHPYKSFGDVKPEEPIDYMVEVESCDGLPSRSSVKKRVVPLVSLRVL